MGLIIMVGLLIVAGIIFWLVNEKYYTNWTLVSYLICFGLAIIIFFSCFLGCLCNHSSQNKEDLRSDYHTLVLALEAANDPVDYYNLIPKVREYNEAITEQRRGRDIFWVDIIYSREIAEMPLIDLTEYNKTK